jgi:hypothetical protein
MDLAEGGMAEKLPLAAAERHWAVAAAEVGQAGTAVTVAEPRSVATGPPLGAMEEMQGCLGVRRWADRQQQNDWGRHIGHFNISQKMK